MSTTIDSHRFAFTKNSKATHRRKTRYKNNQNLITVDLRPGVETATATIPDELTAVQRFHTISIAILEISNDRGTLVIVLTIPLKATGQAHRSTSPQ